jgi:hypothetical protein
MKRKWQVVLISLLALAWLSGCATTETKKVPYRLTPQGMVIWEDEFEFQPPPPTWKLLRVEEQGDINFGFVKKDGPFPAETSFAYDEEPFGSSTKLDDRAVEFLKRFLSNANLRFQVLEKKNVQVLGGEGLEMLVEGKEPVKKEKVRSKLIFGKRGERVVGFYISQWRPEDGAYDLSSFEAFDKFWKSFKFLKKSFYENL